MPIAPDLEQQRKTWDWYDKSDVVKTLVEKNFQLLINRQITKEQFNTMWPMSELNKHPKRP